MSHLYRTSEWEQNGHFYVNDIAELGTSCAGKWYVPARMLGMKLEDYILMLKNEFNAQRMKYFAENDVFVFSFDTLKEARAYKNWINKQARDKNFII